MIVGLECTAPLDIGDQRFPSVLVTDEADVPTDTVMEMTVRRPDGTSYNPTVAHVGTGEYEFTMEPFDQKGIWHWRIAGTGTINIAEEGELRVRGSSFA